MRSLRRYSNSNSEHATINRFYQATSSVSKLGPSTKHARCQVDLRVVNTMVWPFGASAPNKGTGHEDQPKKRPVSWPDSLRSSEVGPLEAAKAWAPMVGFSLVGLAALQLYANYLRRIPGAAYVRPNFFRNRSLYGKVTSVGDGDNFHLFHTPGGKAVGWGWLRKVPESRKELKGRTVRILSSSRACLRGANIEAYAVDTDPHCRS